jgi:hypothetical protein
VISRRRYALAFTAGAVLSGAPSTVIAIARGDDLLESSLAAGTLLLDEDAEPLHLLLAGGVTHLAISAWWATVLAIVLPVGRRTRWGAAAGLAIAALDLGVVARRYPRVRALAVMPQVADHVAFGVLVGWMLDRTEPVHGPAVGPGTLRPS